MQYTIAQDHYVPEFNVELYVGGTVNDGDLEPDLVAQLVSQGVFDPVTEAVEMESEAVLDTGAEAEETPIDDVADEAPVSRRRGRSSDS